MKNLFEIQIQLTSKEQVSNLETIKGGAVSTYKGRNDDKRRQRPSGGTTTTSPVNMYNRQL